MEPERNLTCVLFPGIVKNEEKALQCLGGIRNISQVYSQTSIKKRLGLNYQPENPFVKKIYGDNRKTAGVLLKLKVKKIRTDTGVKKEVISTTVVGRVTTIYKFESLCDFQYMPVHREGSGPLKCCIEQILPSGTDTFSFMNEPCPLFVVPSSFTRSEKPTNYSYTDKRYYAHGGTDDSDDNIHTKRRTTRMKPYNNRYDFSLTNELPNEPHESVLKELEQKFAVEPHLREEFDIVKKFIDGRPVSSLNVIKYVTKVSETSLKVILPALAVNIRKGPWKMCWAKYGYDPRKEPEARIYQTLDFRVRNQAGVNTMVTTRMGHFHKKLDENPNPKKPLNESSTELISEGTVYFRPGTIPTQRQVYYQYCDIQLPEVQLLISLEPAPGYLCHQTRGWLPPNTDQVCRDHIFRYVKEAVLASYNADLKFEQGGSSDDDSENSDDEGQANDEETKEVQANVETVVEAPS